jgi:hypothetical protein
LTPVLFSASALVLLQSGATRFSNALLFISHRFPIGGARAQSDKFRIAGMTAFAFAGYSLTVSFETVIL